MRKPRDYDSELRELDEKVKRLRERKVQQLGDLVAACGADALSPEHLAGALLGIAGVTDAATKEGWRERGAAFFRRPRRKSAGRHDPSAESTLPFESSSAPA